MPGVHKEVPCHALKVHDYSKLGKKCTLNAFFTKYLNEVGKLDKSNKYFTFEFAQGHLARYVHKYHNRNLRANYSFYEPTDEFMKVLLQNENLEKRFIHNKIWAACAPVMSESEMDSFDPLTYGKYKINNALQEAMLSAENPNID